MVGETILYQSEHMIVTVRQSTSVGYKGLQVVGRGYAPVGDSRHYLDFYTAPDGTEWARSARKTDFCHNVDDEGAKEIVRQVETGEYFLDDEGA